MFLHLFVILFGGSGRHPPPGADTPLADTPRKQTPLPGQTPSWVDTTPLGADIPPRADTPPYTVHAGRYGQQAGGTHPTGMHTCYFHNFMAKFADWQLFVSVQFEASREKLHIIGPSVDPNASQKSGVTEWNDTPAPATHWKSWH